MKTVQELIGNKAAERLKERYGDLVDWIGVKEQGPQVFKMELRMLDWKKMSTSPSHIEKERALDEGLAELEATLYAVLFDFGEKPIEEVIHRNNNLPRNGIHMHPEIYAKLTALERESMRRIEERLKH